MYDESTPIELAPPASPWAGGRVSRDPRFERALEEPREIAERNPHLSTRKEPSLRGRLAAGQNPVAGSQILVDRRTGRLEGPFTYPSGWRGYYDAGAGRYLGLDDVYLPRDFDPSAR